MSLSLVSLSWPYLRAVWLRKKAGGFSCRMKRYFCACKLRFSSLRCESALSEHYFRAKILKLRCSCWSCKTALRTLPSRVDTYDLRGAAAGMRFAYNFGRSYGNALRAPRLQPELSESSSRTFVHKFATILQAELCESFTCYF